MENRYRKGRTQEDGAEKQELQEEKRISQMACVVYDSGVSYE